MLDNKLDIIMKPKILNESEPSVEWKQGFDAALDLLLRNEFAFLVWDDMQELNDKLQNRMTEAWNARKTD